MPAKVTIPAGATSATFNITTPTDGVPDGNKVVAVTASATGYTSGSDLVVVTDIDLPDLVVASASISRTGLTDAAVPVSYRIENRGIAPSKGTFVTRVYLSDDQVLGNDLLLGEYSYTGELPVGGAIDRTVQLSLPSTSGTRWLIVVVDATSLITEILENNNTYIAQAPVDVSPAYTATAQTTITTALAGTHVPITGSVVRAGGGAAAGGPVNLHFWLRCT